MNAFGGGLSTKWGSAVAGVTMVWGSSKWGRGILTTDTKNMVAVDFAMVTGDSITPTSSEVLEVTYFRTISATVSPVSTEAVENLYDGTLNWKYVFPGNTANFASMSSSTWVAGSSSSVTFVCGSTTTISWSSL